jgi:PPP family 3-phenylpropionic acid transporter
MQSHRLRALYFLYFAAVGVLMTFGPWHFEAVGLNPAAIGAVFAARTALALVVQPIYGIYDDRSGRPLRLLRWTLGAAFVASFLLPGSSGPLSVVLGVLLVSLFESAFVPVSDAHTLRTQGPTRYGGIRLWGSLGYGVVVAVVGFVALHASRATTGRNALWVTVALLGAAFVVAVVLRDAQRPASDSRTPAVGPSSSSTPLERLPITLPLVLFLASGAFHWFAITAFNIFYSLRVAEAGHGAMTVGSGVLLAVVSEAMAFAGVGWLLRRWDAALLLIPAYVSGIVRWSLVAYSDDPALLVGVQVLHALGFGVWFAASLGVLRRLGPDSRAGTLQSWFTAAVLSGGGIAGGLVLGQVAAASSQANVFVVAACAEAAAIACLLPAVRPLMRAQPRVMELGP